MMRDDEYMSHITMRECVQEPKFSVEFKFLNLDAQPTTLTPQIERFWNHIHQSVFYENLGFSIMICTSCALLCHNFADCSDKTGCYERTGHQQTLCYVALNRFGGP